MFHLQRYGPVVLSGNFKVSEKALDMSEFLCNKVKWHEEVSECVCVCVCVCVCSIMHVCDVQHLSLMSKNALIITIKFLCIARHYDCHQSSNVEFTLSNLYSPSSAQGKCSKSSDNLGYKD